MGGQGEKRDRDANGTRPVVIHVAEFTTNHMGNLNVLLRMVEKAKEAGASMIKMQKKDVETFYSQEKLDSPFKSPYGQTYRDYRTIFEFDDESFHIFDIKCEMVGIPWFITIQDCASLEFLDFYPDLPMLKIASSNARNFGFIDEVNRVFEPDRPIVISVGGSCMNEIRQAVDLLGDRPIYVLHCVAEYPCPPENLRLGNIRTLIEEFWDKNNVTIGYSGHEEGTDASIFAKRLGAGMIERHFCLSRHSFVHHIDCSLEPAEFKHLVDSWTPQTSLPVEAFTSDFGMTETEAQFLQHQTYGKSFLGKESRWAK